MEMNFKYFLLNENRVHLGEKIGDILSAVNDLTDEGANMGARQMVKFSEKIVALIRRILHSNWPRTEEDTLKRLQKVAYNLMLAIDPKDKNEKVDLNDLMPSVQQELQDIVSDLGTPINRLGDTDGEPDLQTTPPPAPDSPPTDNQQPPANPADMGAPPPPPPNAGQPMPPTSGPGAPIPPGG
jgi:hypothetical protein